MASEVVFGIQEVIDALGGWSGTAKFVIEQAFRAGVDEGVALAYSLTPVRTGYLQSRNQRKDVGWKGHTFEVDMVNDASYSAYVNFGTVRQAPQPFFSQGVEAATQAINNNLNSLK